MVFWDSRTIHQGKEAMKDRKVPNHRCVAYLCYTPRSLCSDKILEKKIKAYQELRTTNHWPHKPKVFPKMPRTFGKEVAPISQIKNPKLSDLGKILVGYKKSNVDIRK